MTDTTTLPIGLSPYLNVGGGGAAAAIDFWKKAFGATEVTRMPAEDGKRLMHSHLIVNGSSLMAADYFPERGHPAKTPAGVTLHLQVTDARMWWDRAIAAGCTVAMPLETQFWGDIYGLVTDLFGFTWAIGQQGKPQG
jgi:PhnB protein